MFSTDHLIIQVEKLYFSITKPHKDQFEDTVFNQEQEYCTWSLYHIAYLVFTYIFLLQERTQGLPASV